MARIQPLSTTDAPEASRPLLEGVQKKLGMIPNLYATLAHSPAALSATLGFGQNLSEGSLSAGEREQIALLTGQTNSCDYCLAAHTAIGKSVGLTEAETLAAREGRSDDPKSQALLDFTNAILKQRGFVETPQLEAFRAAGFTDAQALEVVAAVAQNVLTNYANHLAETAVDFPAAPALARS